MVGFAGIEPQATFDRKIVTRQPTGKCWQVVGREGHERVFAIKVLRDETAVGGALEQHDLERPYAKTRKRILEAWRDGAKVFADDDAAVRIAFFHRSGKQGLEWKAHIGALVGPHAPRNEIEALEPQNVIDADRARILHGGAQDLTERRAVALDQAQWIDPGEPPTLAFGIELVRWSANLER